MIIEVENGLVDYRNVSDVEVVRVPLGYAAQYHMKNGTSIIGDYYTDPTHPADLRQSFIFWSNCH